MFFGIDIISEFITLSDNIEKVGAMKVLPPHNKGGMGMQREDNTGRPLEAQIHMDCGSELLKQF